MITNTNNTTSRLIMAPVALLVMVLLWLLVNWEVGMLCAGLVVYLSPELMVIVSPRWRRLKAKNDREEEQRIRELYEELDRKYKGVKMDDDEQIPILPIDDPRLWDRDFKSLFN